MKLRYHLLILVTSILSFSSLSFAQEKFIVSSDWLSEHLNDDNLIILQVGREEDFKNEHIPGTAYIAYNKYAPEADGLGRQMPSVEYLVSLFEGYGITNSSRIILYTDQWVTPTARLYLALDYIGFGDQTSILNGGLINWKNENRSVTDKVFQKEKGKIIPDKKDIIASKDYILKNLSNSLVTIIDARTEDFYSATADMDHYPRPGHISGAYNIQFTDLITEEEPYFFKSESELKKYYDNAFVKKGNTTVAYCHIGQQASLVYFIGKMLGYNMKLYDGSFEEWSADDNCPVTGRVKVKIN